MCVIWLKLKKMSCDLLENAKQGYKTSNGPTLQTNPTDEVVAVQTIMEANTYEPLVLSYTHVSCY